MESPLKNNDQEELLVQSNALIQSRQTFTLLQQRILALAVQQINKNDNPDTEYKVLIQDLVDLSNSKNIYNQIEEETRKLAGKVVTHKGKTSKGKRFFTHWTMIKKAKHIEDSGELIIQFHTEIAEQLFDLKGKFGSAVAIEKASCKSVFGARIYEILLDYWRFEEVEFSVKDLKYMLGLNNKFKSFTQFRKYVLKKAQNDVAENTQLRFTWRELKKAKGRGKAKKITHIKFDFSWKANQMNLPMEQNIKSEFDIYNLRERLKEIAKLEQNKINKVMRYLEQATDDQREHFKQSFYQIQCNIHAGSIGKGKPIYSVPGYAWKQIKPLLET